MRYALPGKHTNQHAVVIGSGLNGLLAARVLAEQFSLVSIITQGERLQASSLPTHFKQAIPQHILSLQGQRNLERLFPGMKTELMTAGAPGIDWAADVPMRLPGGWGPRFHSDLTTRSATLNLLEYIIQRRLMEYSRGCVEFLENQTVVGFDARGVQLADGLLKADVVVDATGNGDQAADWLTQAGYESPQQTRISAQANIVARLYRRPHGLNPGWRGLILMPDERGRGGVLLPVEEGRWLVMLTGYGGETPTDDEAGFLAFASDLSPLDEALQMALPLSPIFAAQHTDNLCWHYERMAHWPDHVLITSAATYNPAFGLDLTTATVAAFALREALIDQRRRDPEGELKGLGGRFQRRLARAQGFLWRIVTLHDSRWSQQSSGGLLMPFLQWYSDHILAAAVHDAHIYQTMIETAGLIVPVHRLYRPSFVRRLRRDAASANTRQAGPPLFHPDQPHKTITQEVMSVAGRTD